MHVPKTVALHHWRGLGLPVLTENQHRENQQAYAPLLRRLRDETPNVNLINPTSSLLSEQHRVKFVNQHGILLYRDDDHLTVAGSMLLKPLFEDLFRK